MVQRRKWPFSATFAVSVAVLWFRTAWVITPLHLLRRRR